jgi:hypothetical protein
MQRLLIAIGVALVLAGVFWPWLKQLPLGRLPGDLVFQVGGCRVYLPITTMVLLSIVLTVLLRLFR